MDPMFHTVKNATRQERVEHWYHFGCPVYVTDDQIQQGKITKGGK